MMISKLKSALSLPVSRRCFLGAAALASLAPGVMARTSLPPWAEEAADAAAPLAAACFRHPFVQGLADGSLSEERFLFYIGQNIHYLKAYQQSLRALAKRMRKPAHRRRFEAWADETVQTEAWSKDIFKSFSSRSSQIPAISPTT